MTFLIVEDAPMMRRVIMNVLSSFPESKFIQASDGLDALEILKTKQVDFILTDWIMPNMDGIEFIKNVKQNENTKDIPIIMVSTRSHKNDIIKAVINKVDDYITKPFTPQIVQDKINNIIQKKNLKF